MSDVKRLCSLTFKNSSIVNCDIYACVNEYSSVAPKAQFEVASVPYPVFHGSVTSFPFVPLSINDALLLSSPFVNQHIEVICVMRDDRYKPFFRLHSVQRPVRLPTSLLMTSTPSCVFHSLFPSFSSVSQIAGPFPPKMEVDAHLMSRASEAGRFKYAPQFINRLLFRFCLFRTFKIVVDVEELPLVVDETSFLGVKSDSGGDVNIAFKETINTRVTRPLILSGASAYPVLFRVSV